MGAEARIHELGLELPAPFAPIANYAPAVRTGNLIYLSGMGPLKADGSLMTGRVGSAVMLGEARGAARLVGLAQLANLRKEIGSLDRVIKIVKLLGMVNCAPGFTRLPEVIDGCSDLLVDVFGREIGNHARSAVGMAELPLDIPVEIEMIVECDFSDR